MNLAGLRHITRFTVAHVVVLAVGAFVGQSAGADDDDPAPVRPVVPRPLEGVAFDATVLDPQTWKRSEGSGFRTFDAAVPAGDLCRIRVFPLKPLDGPFPAAFDAAVAADLAAIGVQVVHDSGVTEVGAVDGTPTRHRTVVAEGGGRRRNAWYVGAAPGGRLQIVAFTTSNDELFERHGPAAAAFMASLHYASGHAPPRGDPDPDGRDGPGGKLTEPDLAAFRRLDATGEGWLDRVESAGLEAYDVDRDAQVTWIEFVVGRITARRRAQTPDAEKLARQTFETFDITGNGYLSGSELRGLERFDLDADGRLPWEEFRDGLMRGRERLVAPRPASTEPTPLRVTPPAPPPPLDRPTPGPGARVDTDWIASFARGVARDWAPPQLLRVLEGHLPRMEPADRARLDALLLGCPRELDRCLVLKAMLVGEAWPDLVQYAHEMGQMSEAQVFSRSTMRDAKDVVQVWQDSCGPTMFQMLVGEWDPRFAWELNKDPDITRPDPVTNVILAAQQKLWLEEYGGVAVPRGAQGGKGIGIKGFLDDKLGSVLGVRFNVIEVRDARGTLSEMIRILEAGYDVPLRVLIGTGETEAGSVGHFTVATAVRQGDGEVEFHLHDPFSGRTGWVPGSAILRDRWPGVWEHYIRLTHWYEPIPFR